MTQLALDNFTGTAGAAIAGRVSDSGHTWVKNGGFSGSASVITDANAVRGTASPWNFYNLDYTIPSFTYHVYFTLKVITIISGQTAGVIINASKTAFDFYYIQCNDGAGQLTVKSSPGGSTVGSAAISITAGKSYEFKVKVTSTNKTIYYREAGVGYYVPIVVVTDTSVSGPRTAGIVAQNAATNTTGIHIDRFSIADSAGDPDAETEPSFDGTNLVPSIAWDNVVDFDYLPTYYNAANAFYKTNVFARYIFRTDHTSLDLGAYNEIGAFTGALAIRVTPDSTGVTTNYAINSSTAGAVTFTQSLGAGEKTVEIVSGYHTKSSSAYQALWPKTVSWSGGTYATAQSPTAPTNRQLFYGDSITAGAFANNGGVNSYVALYRAARGNVMAIGGGLLKLSDDASTSTLRSALASHIALVNPARLIMLVGYNDKVNGNTAAATWGGWYGSLLDAIHTALPTLPIYCISPLITVSSEGANAAGSTMDDYRAQVASVCAARSSYATHITGKTLITTAELSDDVHPTTAGHLALYNALASQLPGFGAPLLLARRRAFLK